MIIRPHVYKLMAPKKLVAEQQPPINGPIASGHVLIETQYSAISPGTELAAFNGLPALRPGSNPYPRLVGYCNVGRILECGEDVVTLRPGEFVLTHSAHRSIDVISTKEVLCKVPKEVNHATVSTTYLFHLGLAASLAGPVVLSDNVALIGLGTLGLASAAIVSRAGGFVHSFSNNCCLDILQNFGIVQTSKKSIVANRVLDTFDVVISTTNSWEDWNLALRLARHGGTIVCLGFPGRGQELPNFNPLSSEYFYDKQLTFKSCGYAPDMVAKPQDVRFTLKRNCEYLMNLIINEQLPANSLIESIRPESDLQEIYNEMSSNRKSGKTYVLDWKS